MKFWKIAWKNIRRSPYQAVAAILVMTLTFFIITLFSLATFSLSKVVNYFETKPQVTAFFKDEAKQDQIDSLESTFKKSGVVSSIKFVSKEEALKIYKQQNKNDPLLLDLVTADILPSSLEISTYDVNDLTLIADTLKKSSIVEEVVFQKDVISRLSSWTKALRIMGFGFITFLGVVSTLTMVIIIGVKISQKREDIETMRLIGAGGWYVRWPFLLEGMFYGIVGALIGWLVSMGILFWITPFLTNFFRGIPIFPLSPLFLGELLLVELILAILLGMFSSYLAVLRYLK